MSDNRENKHNEEPHDSEEEKYSFLQETVKDEQRSKKGIMGNLCRLAGRGLIFGLAAGLAFYALRPWAMTHLGGENQGSGSTGGRDSVSGSDCRRLSGDEPCIIPGGIVSRKKCG